VRQKQTPPILGRCHADEYRERNTPRDYPISSLTGAAPIEFDVSASGDDYVDLANSFLCMGAKITRINNDNLDAADTVGPVNNFLHSLFSQLDVSLNGTLITSSTITYAQRAYIETLLNYGLEAKSSQLTSAQFSPGRRRKMNKPNPLWRTH
jgi:hypothetical protein